MITLERLTAIREHARQVVATPAADGTYHSAGAQAVADRQELLDGLEVGTFAMIVVATPTQVEAMFALIRRLAASEDDQKAWLRYTDQTSIPVALESSFQAAFRSGWSAALGVMAAEIQIVLIEAGDRQPDGK